MKLSDILVLTLFIIMGALIFMMKKMQYSEMSDSQAGASSIVSAPNTPSSVKVDRPSLSSKHSSPEMAGSYGRLSLDNILTIETEPPVIKMRDSTPSQSAETLRPNIKVVKPQSQNSQDTANNPPSL